MSAPMPPALTDRAALGRNRARARRTGPATFLHDEALAEIQERLGLVNRRFTTPAIVSGWPEIWAAAVPGARVVADDDVLDFAPGGHDLVIHAMALHWAADPVGQVIQCARALRPDGLFLAVAPGGRTLHELRTSLAEAEAAVTGGLTPRVLPMAEVRDLGGLLSRAGLALPVADVVGLSVSYRTIRHLAADLRAMGEGNALAARARRTLPPAVLREAEKVYATHFPAPDGRIAATMELMFLTGWAPHESQQKPLRPGSAVARLADALKPVED
ncbi:methyltransferase domain-containing protein [Frigidibacter sp. SD6-1]|uniref:methyltransferase domain-containing protein n=1 Tax=Frigidibacter sp. SD6-1 TaxID=3032581 RepID=UPI0024E03979|nr:methyltransferase domain-containing protein [Frigidibacter sp. SD6-1]